jgi:hypothetical protein
MDYRTISQLLVLVSQRQQYYVPHWQLFKSLVKCQHSCGRFMIYSTDAKITDMLPHRQKSIIDQRIIEPHHICAHPVIHKYHLNFLVFGRKLLVV